MPRIASGLVVAAVLLAMHTGAGAAENYPSRPVRIIIPSGAGGITDILGRVIAPRLTEGLGQQVVIDNRPGASGIVGSQIVAKAPPDGHTLLMVFPSHVVNQSLYPDVPYDTVKAFAPITMVSAVSPVLIVNSQFPARSVQELIAIAKDKPGQLNHGSTGSGSMGHLGAVLFRSMAGIKITLVTYKGAPQSLTALLAGEIQLYLVGSAGTAATQVKAGRVRALGVGAKQRIAALPDVPPIADTLPGYENITWHSVVVPARTPKPIVAKLSKELMRIIKQPEIQERFNTQGLDAVGSTPEVLGALIKQETVMYGKLVKQIGLKPQ
jgi:tripartite-type tricarboxylate transporter receptor subunit TctC